MLLNKRDASTRCISSGHLKPQNNRGSFTQQFSAKCFRQQPFEEAIGIHIDIDNHNDIDLKLNKKIFLHHWHLTTSSFKFRGCYIWNGYQQGATSGMGISKVQQRVAQYCLQQSSKSRYGIDIVNYKFDIKMWNRCRQQQVRSEDMDSTSTLKRPRAQQSC